MIKPFMSYPEKTMKDGTNRINSIKSIYTFKKVTKERSLTMKLFFIHIDFITGENS